MIAGEGGVPEQAADNRGGASTHITKLYTQPPSHSPPEDSDNENHLNLRQLKRAKERTCVMVGGEKDT